MLSRYAGRVTGWTIAALAIHVVGCGGNPIEDQQRVWLTEQHAVEKRLVAVRAAHIETRQALAPVASGRATDDTIVTLGQSAISHHDTAIARIENMFDQQSGEREAAIRSDDPEQMATALAGARREYAAARVQLDSLAAAINTLKRRLPPPDTTARR